MGPVQQKGAGSGFPGRLYGIVTVDVLDGTLWLPELSTLVT